MKPKRMCLVRTEVSWYLLNGEEQPWFQESFFITGYWRLDDSSDSRQILAMWDGSAFTDIDLQPWEYTVLELTGVPA